MLRLIALILGVKLKQREAILIVQEQNVMRTRYKYAVESTMFDGILVCYCSILEKFDAIFLNKFFWVLMEF